MHCNTRPRERHKGNMEQRTLRKLKICWEMGEHNPLIYGVAINVIAGGPRLGAKENQGKCLKLEIITCVLVSFRIAFIKLITVL